MGDVYDGSHSINISSGSFLPFLQASLLLLLHSQHLNAIATNETHKMFRFFSLIKLKTNGTDTRKWWNGCWILRNGSRDMKSHRCKSWNSTNLVVMKPKCRQLQKLSADQDVPLLEEIWMNIMNFSDLFVFVHLSNHCGDEWESMKTKITYWLSQTSLWLTRFPVLWRYKVAALRTLTQKKEPQHRCYVQKKLYQGRVFTLTHRQNQHSFVCYMCMTRCMTTRVVFLFSTFFR